MSETSIHPSACVEHGAMLGTGVKIGAFSVIGKDVELHDNVHIHAKAHIAGHTSIGENTEVYPFCALGQPPQDAKYKGGKTQLRIGKRNVIREHVTMHLGTEMGNGVTVIGDDGYFMVGAHVAHDCVVGDHVIFANSVAIGGYVQIGDYANLSGLVGVHQFTRIGHHAFIGALAYVSQDIIPYGMAIGNPAALNGLNITGMKRANMNRADIHKARAAYKMLFCEKTDLFEQQVANAAQSFAENVVSMEIINFIKSKSRRPLCVKHAR